jgi:hypothetical protein
MVVRADGLGNGEPSLQGWVESKCVGGLSVWWMVEKIWSIVPQTVRLQCKQARLREWHGRSCSYRVEQE